MKKAFLPFLLIITLSACGYSDSEIQSPDFNINASADIEYLTESFSADIKTGTDGALTVTVTSPENLRGIEVVCSADSMTAQCGDVKIPCENGYLPFTQLYKIISYAKMSVPDTVTSENGKSIFEYINGGDKYIFSADSETGRIIRIETPVCIYNLTVD